MSSKLLHHSALEHVMTWLLQKNPTFDLLMLFVVQPRPRICSLSDSTTLDLSAVPAHCAGLSLCFHAIKCCDRCQC
eukprot:16384333-Heterocapsa_arctica.AAC.1